MGATVDAAYESLNKYTKILCGDKAELLQTEDSNITALADGMGSGVKANILSTLTSKILGTMFPNKATPEECMNTISGTLPICQARQVAYSTFSILQVCHNGDTYLVEYDNPRCILIRDGKFVQTPRSVRVVQDREISRYRFKVEKDDALILMSDGTIRARVSELLNFRRLWRDTANYAVGQYPLTVSTIRLAASISRAYDGLYRFRSEDNTTAARMWIVGSKSIHLMTRPARNPENDVHMVQDFMDDLDAKTIICGGTSATIVSKVPRKKLGVSSDYVSPEILLIACMEGVGLVTGGVLTPNRVLQLLRRYVKNETASEEFFHELDRPNRSSMVTKVSIKDCTEVHLYVGRAIDSAYQNPGLLFDLGIHQNLVEQLGHVIEEMGKTVIVAYY